MAAGLFMSGLHHWYRGCLEEADSVASFEPKAVSTHAKWWARRSEPAGFRYMLAP